MKDVPAKYKYGVTLRAVIVGLLLIPLNSYWVFLTEIVRYAGHPTTISVFYNVIFTLFVLVGINALIKRWIPRWAFSQGELLTVYVMLCISSALVGHDSIQVLVPLMSHPVYFASPENKWQSLFLEHMPKWLIVQDKGALTAFYHGQSSIYNIQNLRAWLTPVLWWSAFVVTLLFVFLCLNVLLRKQWTEREKLTYPLVHLPLDMTAEGSAFWRNRLLWAGFALAASIDIVNGLSTMFPSIPPIPIKLEDQSMMFTRRPWTGIGWFPIDFYPFGIGLGMLLPLDLSFSCWFFFIIWKAQLIISTWLGYDSIPYFPYVNEQSLGAYLGICVFAIMMSRHHLLSLVRHFFYRKTDIDDTGEPIPYRAAMWGVVVGCILLFAFAKAAGMSTWVILVFYVVFFALIITITRMRAELGPPAHDLHNAGPDKIIPTIMGPANLGTKDLTMLTMFYGFNRAYRSVPSPFQLEGFKMAERAGMSYSRLFWTLILASVVGTLAAFWANLHHLYNFGAGAQIGPPNVPLIFGAEGYNNRLSSWLVSPLPPDMNVAKAIGVGFAVTMLLNAARMRLPWFMLHPVGYAISSSWSMHRLWVSLLIAWLIKSLILRYGGLKMYRTALPFFLGIILGECVVGGVWTLIGGLLNVPTYAFWP